MKLKHFAIASIFAAASFAQGQANHLLISEVGIDVLTEANTENTEEYVEIFNPTGSTIELDNYYLTDFQNYYTITAFPTGLGTGTSDNIIRFPANTDLAPGQVAVVCNKGNLFLTRYFSGSLTTYQNLTGAPLLFETAETNASIPNMTIFNTNTNTPTNWGFTNGGEHVVLFHWDGLTDLVQDVDVVAWGPSGTASNNFLFKSSSVLIDGPDADGNNSAYLLDAGTNTNLALTPAPQILTRTSSVETGEVQTGGNGIGGHDESTENITTTFAGGADPGSATPGTTSLPFTGGNSAPSIANVAHSPLYPSSATPVIISAVISDFEGPITSATIFSDSGSGYVAAPMVLGTGNNWSANLGTFADDTAVKYYIQAQDGSGLVTTFPTAPALFKAVIVDNDPVDGIDLVINEIRYDLPGADTFEFVELHNTRETTISVAFFTFGDATTNRFTLPESASIPANGYLVMANGFNDFTTSHPAVTNTFDLGAIPFNNDGDTLRVFHANEPVTPIDSVAYDNIAPWPLVGGTDKSLELRDANLDNAVAESWVESPQINGTPGSTNSILLVPSAASDWTLFQ